MKKVLPSTFLAVILISGCGSSESSSGSIELWDYVVSKSSSILSFDKIETVDSEASSTEIGSYTHEYEVISDSEVKGPYRTYDGEYLFEKGSYISYGPSDENASGSYASGSIVPTMDIGDYIYMSKGSSGWFNSSGGTTFSVTTTGKECVISKLYDNITLYDGYDYSDVLEVTCETSLDQEYTPTQIVGNDIHKEYYQKDTGWIAKVNSDCIVAIADNGYEFIDDDNTTCVKTTTSYELLKNVYFLDDI